MTHCADAVEIRPGTSARMTVNNDNKLSGTSLSFIKIS
jgi:hypothetical protein